MRRRPAWVLIVLAAFALGALRGAGPSGAQEQEATAGRTTRGQSLYVPVYSHVPHGDRQQPFLLAVTLCVRNADPAYPIRLVSVEYHDSEGKHVRSYLKDPVRLLPLAAECYVVRESDTKGGIGASFLVRWSAEKAVVAPVVQSVMIGTAASQGISFVCEGRVIQDAGR